MWHAHLLATTQDVLGECEHPYGAVAGVMPPLEVIEAGLVRPEDAARHDVAVAGGLHLLHLVVVNQFIVHGEQPGRGGGEKGKVKR